MARADRKERRDAGLPDLVRRQIGTAVNRRHLSRLPAFALEREVPDELTRLLADLEAAEREANAGHRKA